MLQTTSASPGSEARRLSAILDGLKDGFYALDRQECFVDINSAAEAYFGVERGTVVGLNIVEVFPLLANSRIETCLRRVLATQEPLVFEAASVVRAGRVIEFNVFPLEGGLGVSFRDVTEVRRAETALHEGQARLERATRAAELGVWDWTVETGEMDYSEQAKAVCGFAPGEAVTFEAVRAATHPEDLPRTLALARRALDPSLRERVPYEYRIVRPSDGAVRWVLAHGEAMFAEVDGTETAIRYIGTIQDITARHEADEALRSSEGRLRLAVEAGRMAVWVYDVATDTVQGSPELNRLLGFPLDARPSLGELRARYYPGEQDRLRAAGQDALARAERFFEVAYRIVWPDGSLRWLLMRAEIEMSGAGEPRQVVGVLLDITDRKRAEEHRELLINELNHRVKNTLATVQSLAGQAFRGDERREARAAFEGRLFALAQAHDVLTRENWEGADLAGVVADAVAPYRQDRGERFAIEGTNVWVNPRMALATAMALHELSTNAVKYGALSVPAGQVAIAWTITPGEPRRLTFRWTESGGPTVSPPTRTGFGTRLIERSLAFELGGTVDLTYDPGGVVCVVSAPLGDAHAQPGQRPVPS